MNSFFPDAIATVAPLVKPGRFCQLDFTSRNRALQADVVNDIDLFTRYVNDTIMQASADYGIGGYNEHRTIYSRSELFDGAEPAEEPRRLHLGVDIWARAGTPVYVPIAGRVHSFANNAARGDYGATILLTHTMDSNVFHTLYGHLSLSSIEGLEEGKQVEAGQLLAEMGGPSENGYWPPHLHFQLILDPGSRRGDYPGVCRYSEREQWLLNSPDPAPLLNRSGIYW